MNNTLAPFGHNGGLALWTVHCRWRPLDTVGLGFVNSTLSLAPFEHYRRLVGPFRLCVTVNLHWSGVGAIRITRGWNKLKMDVDFIRGLERNQTPRCCWCFAMTVKVFRAFWMTRFAGHFRQLVRAWQCASLAACVVYDYMYIYTVCVMAVWALMNLCSFKDKCVMHRLFLCT